MAVCPSQTRFGAWQHTHHSRLHVCAALQPSVSQCRPTGDRAGCQVGVRAQCKWRFWRAAPVHDPLWHTILRSYSTLCFHSARNVPRAKGRHGTFLSRVPPTKQPRIEQCQLWPDDIMSNTESETLEMIRIASVVQQKNQCRL